MTVILENETITRTDTDHKYLSPLQMSNKHDVTLGFHKVSE